MFKLSYNENVQRWGAGLDGMEREVRRLPDPHGEATSPLWRSVFKSSSPIFLKGRIRIRFFALGSDLVKIKPDSLLGF